MADRHTRTNPQQSDKAARQSKPKPAAPASAVESAAVQRALDDPLAASPEAMLVAQKVTGNRAVSRLIQTKLTVGPAGDQYEQEADRVAGQVMAMPVQTQPAVQRAPEEEEELQMKPLAASITPLVQRVAIEEEELQTKPIVQRAPEEEEELQMKPLVQRATIEEEEVQTKPIVQRAPEEEEELQMKPLVQRAAIEEEEVQTKPIVQRAPEAEEELQMKPLVQRAAIEEDELQTKPDIQRASGGAGFEVSGDFEQQLATTRGGGSPLPATVRNFMEPRFGADFSGVRIHTGSQSAQLNRSVSAQAFTLGQDIYLGEGKDDVESSAGKSLLAHELTHVVQQTGAVRRKPVSPGIHAVPHGQVQRLITVEAFKAQTYEGIFSGRGKTLKAIEALIAEYHSIRNPYGGELDRAIAIVSQIRELTRMWIDEHTGDSARTKRMAGMERFLQQLEKHDIPPLEEAQKMKTGQREQLPERVNSPNEKVQKLRARYEGNADSVFSKAAWMIDLAVPNKGESSELEMEVQFPVDPSGVGFIGGRLKFEAERDEMVKVGCEATLTGGGKLPGGVELKGELGGYFESSAKDAATALKLVSYALYRRFVESSWIPREVSSFIWGGTSSFAGYKRAERWASKVEQEAFGGNDETTKNTYVETGMLAGVGAEAKVGVGNTQLGVGGGIKYTTGTRYTKASVESKKQQFLTQKGQFTSGKSALEQTYTPALRGAQAKFGKSMHVLEFSGEVDAGLLKGEASFKLNWAAPDTGSIDTAWYQREAQFDGLEGEVAGTLSMPLGTGMAVTPLVQAFVGNAVTLIRSQLEKDKNTAKLVGNLANFTSDIGGAMSSLLGNKMFEAKFGVEDSAPGLSGSADYSLRVAIGYSPSDGVEITIAVESSQEISLDLEVFKGKQKKTRRVFGIKYKGGWTLI
jgi:hypothetical protein